MVSITLRPLNPRYRPNINCAEGWIGLGERSERARKMLPARGFDPRTVQPVASRYIDFAFILFLRRLNADFLHLAL